MNRSSLFILMIVFQSGPFAQADDNKSRPRVCYLNLMDETVFLLNRKLDEEAIGKEWAGEIITFEEEDLKRAENQKRIDDCLRKAEGEHDCLRRGPVVQPVRSIRPVEAGLVHSLPAKSAWCERRETFTETVDGVTYDAVRPGFNAVRGSSRMSDTFKARQGNNWTDGRLPAVEYRAYLSASGWPQSMVSPNGSVVFSVGKWSDWLTAYEFRYDTDACSTEYWPPYRAGVDPEYETQITAIEVAEREFDQTNTD